MKVLLLGSGARESAMAWKFSSSPFLEKLWIWPAGSVLSQKYDSPDLPRSASWDQIADWCAGEQISLVVSGPEAPLAAGAADIFKSRTKIPFFGPTQSLARLESSKSFSKQKMKAAGIPTADFEIVEDRDACERVAFDYLAKWGKVVLKASGLAAGKGVFVCHNSDDVRDGLTHLYSVDMAEASQEVVVERCLEGRECSYFTMITANTSHFLGFAVDYKRLRDGDEGPNTGGMGTYTSVPWLPSEAEQMITERVVTPLLHEIAKGGESYTGYLYVGIMWTKDGPYILEFNVRLGDPEAQVLAVQDQRDWLEMIARDLEIELPGGIAGRVTTGDGKSDLSQPGPRYTVGVVAASPNYPFGAASLAMEKSLPFTVFAGCDQDLQVFGAALKKIQDGYQTGSGRVMTVVAASDSMEKARVKAYEKIQQIKEYWPEMHCRRDVARI